jgi:electron transport complex protein RnfB
MHMLDPIYRKLAERLDAIPNGFPSTASGAELRLLAKIFTPEEAALASVMRLTPEPAAEIAARAGIEPREAGRILKGMVRKGQIEFSREGRELAFGLRPFVVGFYEAQLPRMDRELAELFEAYYTEVQGRGLVADGPPVHRVLPVGEAVPAQLDVLPYQSATDLIQHAQAWGVLDCICRVQQKLVGKGCDRPINNCLAYAPVANAFDGNETIRAITKEEALQILHETEQVGLVHTTMNHRADAHYICNCCPCCCGVLRGLAEFNLPAAVAHSGFQAAVDVNACVGCGACVERCPLGALSIPEDVSVVAAQRCIGCGLCVTVCPSGALSLAPRPESERIEPPEDLRAWMAERARQRGIALDSIL